MDIRAVKNLAYKAKGKDYYKEYNLLRDDLLFFNMYIQRNRKSEAFHFEVIPIGFGTIRVFSNIMKAYGAFNNYLEETYAVYILLKDIILDIYEHSDERQYPDVVIAEFAEWFNKELGLDIIDYVADFVDCSFGCSNVQAKLCEIIKGV